MSLQPGDRLGVFEILGPLGAGGMGEVYRARDTRLDREVAIKVLPPAFSSDPLRVTRFQREARMLAAINHPAIAAIYGAEESGGVPFIVMELVPGDTLAEWTSRGPLSLEEALSFARQIAEALEAAHERGVVHRDLKPSNIKVTPGGRVKVLDLGLAKMREEEAPPSIDPSHSPTMVLQDQTRPGVILGTVEFMSPEQARGKEVDKRTDIWAFGCVLFEMLSGRRAFTGETISDILVSILTKDPDWTALPAYTPVRVRELLSRCLTKDANQRLRDIGEARVELERTLSGSGDKEPAPPLRDGARWWRWPALLALLTAAGVAAWLTLRTPGDSSRAAALENSLVVLPANVMGDAPDSKLVGDGLVEMLSVRLNEVPGIQVVTPAAAVQASDKSPDPFGAARSVGAKLLVRSSLVRSGDRLRIIYSVWNVQSRAQVFGGTVDGSTSDLFGMQDQLANNVATALKLKRPSKKTPTPAGLETASQQERYVQALGYLQRYDKPASVEAAISLLEGLARESPRAALTHAALGRAYLYEYKLTGRTDWADRALGSSARSQQLDPDLPEVSLTRGEVALRTGHAREAVPLFQQILVHQPQNYDAVLGLAAAQEQSGELVAAEGSYRRAIALQPGYWSAYNTLGGFLAAHGRFAEAADQFRQVVRLRPDGVRGYNNLGASLFLGDRLEEARDAYQKSIALEPNAQAFTNLGTLLYLEGRFEESERTFERATQLEPNKFLHWANLGDAYRWGPRHRAEARAAYAKAMELAQDALKLNPNDGVALRALARCLAKSGELPRAREVITHALALEPGNPSTLVQAAVVANLSGQRAEAVARIAEALKFGLGPLQIEREPEFQSLQERPDFREALARARSAASQRASPIRKEGS